MRRSSLFLLSLWVLSTGAAPTLDADSAPVGNSAGYQVWGCSLKRPRDDRPWSDVCCDRRTAHRRLREILDDYSEHGLLAAASDKPHSLRVMALESRIPQFAVHPLAGANDRLPGDQGYSAKHTSGPALVIAHK